jgi:ABC-2 type transport system ATP-binding protein
MIKKDSIHQYEIWTENLTKVYGKGEKALKAVSQINLRIKPGIHGFLGPNGAGKTTTLNMLIGAISITEGRAKIRDENAGTVAAKQLIGFIPQDPVFYDDMTGEEYLIYLGQLGGLQRINAKKKAQELLESFNLFEARNRNIETYSGGEKQKIAIAAALIHEPKVLILDEPTANLDPIGRADVIKKIKELSKNVSVFISSHILSEIEQMCEDVVMINHGEIVIFDSISNIKKRFVRNLYVFDTNMNDKFLEVLKKQSSVSNVRINEPDGKIHAIPKDLKKLRETLPHLLIEHNTILFSFHQLERSLQDIFMDTMLKKESENK